MLATWTDGEWARLHWSRYELLDAPGDILAGIDALGPQIVGRLGWPAR